MTNEVYRPVSRQLEYITLYGIVQAVVQHQDTEEILSIVDDIVNENDWTVDGDATHTLLDISIVLAGVYKWAKRLPHATFMTQRIADAERSYGLNRHYMCDIGIASDL